MINISKRTVSLLIVTLLLISTFLSAPVTIQAASYPTTHPNTYKNTGNGAVDITELGALRQPSWKDILACLQHDMRLMARPPK